MASNTSTPAPASPLAKLREPFPAHQISKLPKPYKRDAPKGKCAECGGYHGLPAVHLDYVGHAALTDRLLDTDPLWSWEPVGFAPDGLPAFDRNGGLWIKLTVCGVTRLGYGNADGKSGGDAVKEIIGDALRNAAMRFGAALDLWHKGDLHADEEEAPPRKDYSPAALADDFEGANGERGQSSYAAKKNGTDKRFNELRHEITDLESPAACGAWAAARAEEIKAMPEAWRRELRGDLETQRALVAQPEEMEPAE